jgi:hypothetical protein
MLPLLLSFLAASPVVTGPIAASSTPGAASHDYPFFAALEDLKSRGYGRTRPM